MRKLTLLLLISSVFALQGKAQKVTNVKATKQGSQVIVSYKVEGGAPDKVFSPSLYYSTDGGSNYKKCKSTNAKYTRPNQNAQITWNVTKDLDYFGGSDIVFKVKAYGFWNYVKGEATIRGKTYKTIKIGQQEWMAENLAYKVSSGCWSYDNKSSNVSKYGYLYNWEAAKKVAPSGWHLPTDAEWKQLEIYMGMSKSDAENTDYYRSGNVGEKLKSTSGWKDSGNGNNSSGFSALPGGVRDDDGDFYSKGGYAVLWTATAYDSKRSWRRKLGCTYSEVRRDDLYKEAGCSVRLVRD